MKRAVAAKSFSKATGPANIQHNPAQWLQQDAVYVITTCFKLIMTTVVVYKQHLMK